MSPIMVTTLCLYGGSALLFVCVGFSLCSIGNPQKGSEDFWYQYKYLPCRRASDVALWLMMSGSLFSFIDMINTLTK